MKKYIDADLLNKKLTRLFDGEPNLITDEYWKGHWCGYSDCLTAVQDVISDIPAADATEVVHSKWEVVGRTKSNSAILKCSCCGRVRRGHEKSNYCPDCGAKMDKEQE